MSPNIKETPVNCLICTVLSRFVHEESLRFQPSQTRTADLAFAYLVDSGDYREIFINKAVFIKIFFLHLPLK
jgi:hypothetical protein